MNVAQRHVYSRNYIRIADRFQRKYQRPIFKILHAQANAVADIVAEKGTTAGVNNLYLMHTTVGMAPLISKLHVDTGLFNTRRTMRGIVASAKKAVQKGRTLGNNDKWTQDILNFFKTDLFQTVRNITETTRTQLLETISKGITEGWSIDRIVRELRTPDLLMWRARLIARTEIAKANNAAQNIAQKDSEWETTKEWISARDHRVRDAHQKADGQFVDSDLMFVVGGEYMDGPGDPKASLKNICNCRCVAAVLAKRDSAGRLVPKKKRPSVIFPGQFNRPNQRIISI